jgi:hypothetical protein
MNLLKIPTQLTVMLLVVVLAGSVSANTVQLDGNGDFYIYPSVADLAAHTNVSNGGNPGVGTGGDNTIMADGSNWYRLDAFGDLYGFPTHLDLVTNNNSTSILFGNLGVGGGDTNAIMADGTAYYRMDDSGDIYGFATITDFASNTNNTMVGNPGVGGGGVNDIASDGTNYWRLDAQGGIWQFASLADLANNSNSSIFVGEINSAQYDTFGVAVVPEPATLFIMACGMVGIFRKRRSSQATVL